MTIQIFLDDGIAPKTRTYRNVYKGKNLAQYVENFYENKNWCRSGTLTQLKGNERIVLHKFSTVNETNTTP